MARPFNDWRKFCVKFVELGGTLDHRNGFAKDAAKYVGYGNPSVAAVRLFKRADVQQLIKDLVAAALAKTVYQIPSADEILRRIDVESLEAKSSPFARLKALELLGRYRALFQDRVSVDMPRRLVVKDNDGETLTELS